MKADPTTGLTGPQEVFCRELVKLGNAAGAYRVAYPRATKWTQQSVDSAAFRLQANTKVSHRLSQLHSDLQSQSGITLAEHLAELRELRELAKADKQHGAAITAETNRGKVSGLYSDKVELSGPGGGPVPLLLMADDGL